MGIRTAIMRRREQTAWYAHLKINCMSFCQASFRKLESMGRVRLKDVKVADSITSEKWAGHSTMEPKFSHDEINAKFFAFKVRHPTYFHISPEAKEIKSSEIPRISSQDVMYRPSELKTPVPRRDRNCLYMMGPLSNVSNCVARIA